MTLTSDKSEPKVWTDAEFMALPGDARYELVNGELVDMGNSGMEHGEIGAFLAGSLSLYVRGHWGLFVTPVRRLPSRLAISDRQMCRL